MPTFKLMTIPGLSVRGDEKVTLDDASPEENRTIQFTNDSPLWNSEGADVQCRYEQQDDQYILILTLTGEKPFVGSQIYLTELEIRVRYSGSPNMLEPDPAEDAISVQGTAEWRELPEVLGLSKNQNSIVNITD